MSWHCFCMFLHVMAFQMFSANGFWMFLASGGFSQVPEPKAKSASKKPSETSKEAGSQVGCWKTSLTFHLEIHVVQFPPLDMTCSILF